MTDKKSNDADEQTPSAATPAEDVLTDDTAEESHQTLPEPVDETEATDILPTETLVEEDYPDAEERSPDAEDQTSDPKEQAPKKSGRGLGWLAVLLAMGAIAACVYLYYELIYLKPLAKIEQSLAGAQAARDDGLNELREQITAQSEAVNQQLAQAAGQQSAQLEETQAGVLDSLQQALLAAPPSQREWKLAEAEYLLRIGNHRVLMEQDTEGALTVFLAVDQILAELDDFALHQVRAILADEIIALRQVPRTDLQGIYLRLEAIKSSIDRVVFKTPEYIAEEVRPEETETVWKQLTDQLKEFVRVRRVGGDETVQPLLAPSEEQYLELNLRLALEQAQLAALKRQQIVFEHALQNARDWIVAYAEDPQGVLANEIEELMALKLATPVPDISRSLAELYKVRQGGD